jgi:hypothetical protein
MEDRAMQRKRIKHATTFEEGLTEEARQFREEAEKEPPGSTARELLLRRARQAETASHMNDWLASLGLWPPKIRVEPKNMPPSSKIRGPGGNNFSPAPRGINKIPDTDLSARRVPRFTMSPAQSLVACFAFQAHKWGMSESHHRSCQCGAVYSRVESMAPGRQIASFECAVCGTTLESWNTAWVPTYRLIAGPVRQPQQIS